MPATGIHHVTAISSDAQANRDFWAGVLGLRAVKKTVNFDDPQTYHLYYGDERGSPGTILTFFPYGNARRGRAGRGQAAVTALAVPDGSLDWWADRLGASAVRFDRTTRGGEDALAFDDPDGLRLEIVATDVACEGWDDGGVSAEHAIVGVHAVELWLPEARGTREVLEALGFLADETAGGVTRMSADAPVGRYVDLREVGGTAAGVGGVGTVHHVAFRVGGDDDELGARKKVVDMGLSPTPVIDRQYFHSVYFREPGGVLFELATDPPGFDADEPLDHLGEALKLPPQYEKAREQIEAGIRPLLPPTAGPTFAHRWEPRDGSSRTILALHGTGGDENDLVPLARKLDAGASVLSPRGRVDENGMPRFFRRLAEGVFDEESVVREANALVDWLASQVDRYGFDPATVDALGYSNGANVASAALLLRPGSVRSLVLLRPMVPLERLRPEPLPDLSGHRVLLLAGKNDRIAPPDDVKALASLLSDAGADVTTTWQDAGHELTGADIDAATRFLA